VPETGPAAWHPTLGTFGCPVRRPSDWAVWASRTRRLCEQHVDALQAEPPSLRILHRMDEVSNLLCAVIDVAEICKAIHPDPAWRDAAAQTAAELVDYMTTLNHHRGLRDAIAGLIALPGFDRDFSPEEQRVARTLKEEMDANGVGADQEVRAAIAALLQEVHAQTHKYMSAIQADPRDIEEDAEEDQTQQQQYLPPALPYLELHGPKSVVTSCLAKVPADWKAHLQLRGNSTVIRAPHEAAEMLLRVLPVESMRKQVFLQHHSASLLRVPARALERVMHARQLLARTLASESYAHYQVGRCVAKTPEHVENVLTGILEALQTNTSNNSTSNSSNSNNDSKHKDQPQQRSFNPKSVHERRMLQASKFLSERPELESSFSSHGAALAHVLSTPSLAAQVEAVELRPWDNDFLHARVRGTFLTPALAHSLSHYFTVANVLHGYTILLQRLFGIEVRQVAPTAAEDWTGQVSGRVADELIKLELWEDEHNHRRETPSAPHAPVSTPDGTTDAPTSGRRRVLLGVIYLDLFFRPNKFHNAASFNFRSSRQTFFRVKEGAAGRKNGEEGEDEAVPLDASEGEQRQVPVAGIVSVLTRPSLSHSGGLSGLHPRQRAHAASGVSLLSLSDVEMLFHELGHCLHNVLSRTAFQHVAGARGELDFVELPSTLFENFVSGGGNGSQQHHAFVRQWARHFQTDEPIPPALLDELVAAKNALRNTEIIAQASQALFDQRVHGKALQHKMRELQQQHSASFNENALLPPGHLLRGMQPLWNDILRSYSPFRPEADAVATANTTSSSQQPPPQPFVRQLHLLAYGANYYCYIYCRLFASLLWQRLFVAAAAATTTNDQDGNAQKTKTTRAEQEAAASLVAAQAGHRLRQHLFAQGGAKDPELILRQLAQVPAEVPLQQFVEQQLASFVSATATTATAPNEAITQGEAQARLHTEAATHVGKHVI
jgi:intermediate peptidase